MLAALALAFLVASGPALRPPAPTAVRVVPEEPGALFLPDAPTYQALAADLDGDGAREVLRTVFGERGSIAAEAWTQRAAGWEPLAPPVEVIPPRPSAGQGDVVYAGTPARLVLRRVEGADRVTLVRQPEYQDAGDETDCCLLLHDLRFADGGLSLVRVADPSGSVGAVSAIDFDGDGTDELLASRSLPPLGDIGFPLEARVYRWADDAFGPPTLSRLPIGSGDTPFVLGNSDGLPGDEVGVISTAGRPALFRIRLVEGDMLVVDDSGLVATAALGVPTDDGRALAVAGPTVGMAVAAWPAGEPLGEPLGVAGIDDAEIIGVVDLLGERRIAVRSAEPEALHLLALPGLEESAVTVTRSPAAAALAASPLRPYVGPVPGGGLDGEPAVLYAGRLLPSQDLPDAPFETRDSALFATLAGAQPIGLVGSDRGWMGILHAPLPFDRLDPVGGRLDPPIFQPGSGVSLAPIALSRTPERDDGSFEPTLQGATPLTGDELAVAATGFVAAVDAPPGSRVYLVEADPSVVGPVSVVSDTGRAHVVVGPPLVIPGNARLRASLSVVTPAGHAYVATWEIRVLSEPPALEATASTPFGSSEVRVSGRTAPYAEVTVAGRSVSVEADGRFAASVPLPPWPTRVDVVATDPVGNAASTMVSGVGIFDYRGLPWLPISIGLVALAGVVLFLRVPRVRPAQRRAADDAVLEELEPD